MKKILLLLGIASCLGTQSFSQTDLQITTVVPQPNTTYPEVTTGQTIDFEATVTNLGPNSLNATDTIVVSMSLDWLIPFTGYVLQSKLPAASTTLMTAGSSETFTFEFTQGVSLGQTPNGAAIVTVPNFVPINDIVFQVYGYTSGMVLLSDFGSDVINGQISLSGNNVSNPQNVQFGQTPISPEIHITADQDTICSGTNVTFTANVTNPGTNGTYSWKINGNTQGTNTSTFATTLLNNGDEISCDYTATISGSPITAHSDTLSETVHANVVPAVSISANPGTTVEENQTVIFTANYSNGGANPVFQWFKNQFPISGQTGSSLAFLAGSDFQDGDEIEVSMQSNAPCANPVTVTSDPVAMMVQTTGINQNPLTGSSTKIYPNPAQDNLTIANKTLQQGNYLLRIVNHLGQTIFTQNQNIQSGLNDKIDISSFANGVYRVLIIKGSSAIESQTFVKRD